VGDVAIGMAYAAVSAYGKKHPLTAAACLLHGFSHHYPLLPSETQFLLPLTAGRLAISVTLGAYSYHKDPENTYLLIHSEPAWTALHTLWLTPRKQVEELFATAMSSGSSVLDEILAVEYPIIHPPPLQ